MHRVNLLAFRDHELALHAAMNLTILYVNLLLRWDVFLLLEARSTL